MRNKGKNQLTRLWERGARQLVFFFKVMRDLGNFF